MATNAFSKEEIVLFEDMLAGFDDNLVISRNVSKFGTDGELMERSNDTIWRPEPYIANSQDRVVGAAVTYSDVTQLSVPSTLGYEKTVPWTLTAKQMRDAVQEGRIYDSAAQRLASDINSSVRDVASLQGTLCSGIVGAAGAYDDIATCESIMDEQGIMGMDRYLALCTRDHNGLTYDLVQASRSFGNSKSDSAYERSYLGNIANFETYKMQNGYRLAAQSATPTIDTTGSIVQYAPVATRTASTGERSNVDNRYQQVTISSTSGVVAGDCFTVNGITSVNHISKVSTGQPKSFRVISVDSGTTMTISPPMIGGGGGTDAELAYQNISVDSTSATAAITFLNNAATTLNPFWYRDAIELMPGRYQVPTDQGVGVMTGTSDQGIELVLTKKFDPDTFVSSYTLNTFYGVTCVQPEMCGVLFFGQT